MRIKIQPADRWFSLCNRIHHDWTCQMCGTQKQPGSNGLHTAHIFSRRHRATRWMPSNVLSLCFGCHSKFDADHELHREFAVKQLGIDLYDNLNGLRNRVVKVSKKDQADIARFYRELACTMKRGDRLPQCPAVTELTRADP